MNNTGQRAYLAYCERRFTQPYESSDLPAWQGLNANRQAGWAAAEAVPPIKPWWKSKTLWVNAVVLMLAAAETQVGVLQAVLPVNFYAWLAFGLPIVNVFLRLITSTAVGK